MNRDKLACSLHIKHGSVSLYVQHDNTAYLTMDESLDYSVPASPRYAGFPLSRAELLALKKMIEDSLVAMEEPLDSVVET